jgi:hypothetical protein
MAHKTHLLNNRETVFSSWSVLRGYEKDKDDFELVEFQDASLPGYELGSRGIRIESSSGVSSCSREQRDGSRR